MVRLAISFILTLLLLASPSSAWMGTVLIGGGTPVVGGCGLSSDDTLLGNDTVGASSGGRQTGFIYAAQFSANDDCTVDQLFLYFTGHIAGEFVTAGIYTDNGSDFPDSLLSDTGEVDGDGSAAFRAYTLDTSQSLTNGTLYWLAYSPSASMTGKYTSGTGVFYAVDTYTYSSGVLPGTFPGSSNDGEVAVWSVYGVVQ